MKNIKEVHRFVLDAMELVIMDPPDNEYQHGYAAGLFSLAARLDLDNHPTVLHAAICCGYVSQWQGKTIQVSSYMRC